jgi:hypothetical protein
MKKKGILQSLSLKNRWTLITITIPLIVEKSRICNRATCFISIIPAEEIKEQEELNKLRKWGIKNIILKRS